MKRSLLKNPFCGVDQASRSGINWLFHRAIWSLSCSLRFFMRRNSSWSTSARFESVFTTSSKSRCSVCSSRMRRCMDFVSSLTTTRYPGWLNWRHSTLIRFPRGRVARRPVVIIEGQRCRSQGVGASRRPQQQSKSRVLGFGLRFLHLIPLYRDAVHICTGPKPNRGRSRNNLLNDGRSRLVGRLIENNNSPMFCMPV